MEKKGRVVLLHLEFVAYTQILWNRMKHMLGSTYPLEIHVGGFNPVGTY